MQSVDTDASFVYNENGLRVQKTVNGVVTDYTLHGKNVVHMTQGNDELHFFYDAQNKPAVVVYNGVPYSYVKNLQGDVVALLNSAGAVVVSYVYDAWGRPISKTGTLASTLGTVQPFRYRGYVYDEETCLYYLRSRYYNPYTCHFINADVLHHGNLFAYCSNSPIIHGDRTGLAMTCFLDENGHEAIFSPMATGAMGGGVVIYGTNEPEDVSISIALVRTVITLVKRSSLEFGVGTGFRGEIASAIIDVGGGYRQDYINLTLSRAGLFLGQKGEFSIEGSIGLAGIDNLSVGGSFVSGYTHSMIDCDVEHGFFDIYECPYLEYMEPEISETMSFGVSFYMGVGATAMYSLDMNGLLEELVDIWIK